MADVENLEQAIQKLAAPGSEENNTSRRDLYKNWGKYGSQEERRKELLDVQKSNRLNKIDKFRGIIELVNAVEDSKIFKPYNKVSYQPNVYVPGFHKKPLTYSNVLMLSEWMIEKPTDFSENWYIVPCPKGTRMLVIANQGTTKCYNKYGYFKFECWTSLPGGSPKTKAKGNACVLDCFYDKLMNTMFVLDLLVWNTQPMTDGETEFRQFWLKSHLEEISEIKTINKWNKMIFKLLPMTPCTKENLNVFFSTYPPYQDLTLPKLDGLLFYHKQAHYFPGQTPLVGWLFPFMVTEVLGSDLTVNPDYFSGRPEDYTNQVDFIQKFEAKMSKKNNRSRKNSAMDTDNSRNDEDESREESNMESEVITESTEDNKKHEDNAEDMK